MACRFDTSTQRATPERVEHEVPRPDVPDLPAAEPGLEVVDPGVGEAPLKKTLPVMLVDVPLDGSREFHQIDRRQIYRGLPGEARSYDCLENDPQRNRFVNGFVDAIVARVEGKGGYR